MKYERHFSASAEWSGFIYVTGGYLTEYNNPLPHVERLGHQRIICPLSIIMQNVCLILTNYLFYNF